MAEGTESPRGKTPILDRMLGARKKERDRSRSKGSQGAASEKVEEIADLYVDNELDEVESVSGIMYDEGADDYATHLKFTQADPMGMVLLALATDNLALCEKSGLKESNVNVKQLCKSFYLSHQEKEKDKLETAAQVAKSAELVEKRLLDRELNSHQINTTFEAPQYFSPVPTLHSTSARNEVLRLFPTRSQRFSGDKGDKNMGIVEFLSLVSGAQEVCRLSEQEFLDVLKLCTTGKAHMLLLEWLSNGDDPSTIYYQFGLHFDHRLTASEARKQLYSYKVPKSTNMTEAISHVMNLSARACTNLPQGVARTALYNMEATQALIRAVPPASALTINNVFSSLSARMGRAATISELSRALNIYRIGIDTDIRTFGAEGGNNANRKGFFGKKGKVAKAQDGKEHGVFSISQPPQAMQTKAYNQKDNTKSDQRGRPRNKGANDKWNKGNTGKTSQGYCSLCGQVSHRAADGCRNMRDDKNQIIGVIPTQAHCKLCPAHVVPRLNHPPILCPYRAGGPFASM